MYRNLLILVLFFFPSFSLGATEAEVQSITWNPSGWWEFVMSNPGNLSGVLEGVLPLKSLYSGGEMSDLYPAGAHTNLKCKSALVSAPYYASATSTTGTVNISKSFHDGTYNGSWSADAGITHCTSPGVYYAQFNANGSSNTYYFRYYWTGTEIREFNLLDDFPELQVVRGNFNTAFTGVSSIVLSTSTNTISFDVSYYVDIDEIDENNASRNITMILVDYESGTTSQDFAQTGDYITVSDGYSTSSMIVVSDVFANDGTYTFKVSFGNGGTPYSGIYPFAETYVYFDVVISGGVITSTHVDNPYLPSFTTDTTLPCSLTELQGCFINSVSYLIVPSPTTINRVLALQDDVSTRWPFVYAYDFVDIITDMYSGGTSSSSISIAFADYGNIDLISVSQIQSIPFASWLRTMIGYLMWFMFGWLMYTRVLRIFNTNPQ